MYVIGAFWCEADSPSCAGSVRPNDLTIAKIIMQIPCFTVKINACWWHCLLPHCNDQS
jgi:hypothetical protein